MFADKFIHFVFDQFTVYDPGLLSEYITCFRYLRGLDKNIPWRTPVALIAGKLTVTIVRCFLLVIARFRFSDYWIRRACIAKELLYVIARGILADTNYLETLILILLIKLCSDGSFFAPVAAPRSEVDNHHELLPVQQ